MQTAQFINDNSFVTSQVAQFSHEELRHAIDAIATLRARAVRVGFYGALLCRPDPRGLHHDQMRRSDFLDKLKEQREIFDLTADLLVNGTPPPHIPVGICTWIHQVLKDNGKQIALVVRCAEITAKLHDAIIEDSDEANTLLDEHMALGRGTFFDAVTDLCDVMWEDFDSNRSKSLGIALNSANSLAKRLSRLEHIGKHVRLVSLNASVEAARAGDAGLGLSVIAQEFKGLAEEIQVLAKEAHSDVAVMTQQGQPEKSPHA